MQVLLLDLPLSEHRSWIAELGAAGFGVDRFSSLADGNEAVFHIKYQMIVTIPKLPDGSVIDWMRFRRTHDATTPFVMIADAEDMKTRIHALDSGADDCVCPQLHASEFIAKVRAILRRQPIMRSSTLQTGNLRLELVSREAWVNNAPLPLPRRELGILEVFMQAFDRTVTREHLESMLYGANGEVCPNSIEVRVSRLRRCLSQGEADVEIKTLRGIGYRLQAADKVGHKLGLPVAQVAVFR